MPITKLPGVYYDENVDYELMGDGSKIPVFIGYTGNEATDDYKTDGSNIQRFVHWKDVNKAVENGGIGVYTEETDNLLLKTLQEFFEEAKMNTSADIGVPYIYVIDLGKADKKEDWINAFSNAKVKAESTLEVYVGLEKATKEGYSFKDILEAAYASIKAESHYLKLRCGITTKFDVADDIASTDVDAELLKLTAMETGFQRPRMAIAEPFLFGKTVARICVTPANMEPGYYPYRSVEPGTFIDRTLDEQLDMQEAGIIINRDEVLNANTYPKILLGVTTCFASNPRPADSLLHTRFNADQLLSQVFETVYPQIKNNETAFNIALLQTQLDRLVDDEVLAGNMIAYDDKAKTGTKLTLIESDSNPYDMEVIGQIQPVNCTIAIMVEAEIQNAVTQSVKTITEN